MDFWAKKWRLIWILIKFCSSGGGLIKSGVVLTRIRYGLTSPFGRPPLHLKWMDVHCVWPLIEWKIFKNIYSINFSWKKLIFQKYFKKFQKKIDPNKILFLFLPFFVPFITHYYDQSIYALPFRLALLLYLYYMLLDGPR